MEDIGVLVVSYGSRAASMIDALSRSNNYHVKFYVADKQRNPYNLEMAERSGGKHAVIKGLNVPDIVEFAREHAYDIDFGIVGPESFIIAGGRNKIEEQLGIPMICPTLEYALEGSKVRQRRILAIVYPGVNPRYRVFDPAQLGNEYKLKRDFDLWLKEFDYEIAIKPDLPTTGKGVGVWGDHFYTPEEAFLHLVAILNTGSKALVEEKIEGEEFSLQCFSDGEHLIPTPAVRDYKRAFDGDLGPNTGGMGSYKDNGNILPFMSKQDWEQGVEVATKIFEYLRGDDVNLDLCGVPLYMAYTCTRDGIKVFEINSRPGDPEIQNLLPILEDDFVEVCLKTIEGGLTSLSFKPKATVVTYAVSMTYGGYRNHYSGDRKVDLTKAHVLIEKYGDNIRIYPGSMNKSYALSSRTVCPVGIGKDIEEARNISLEAIQAIDGPLWNRMDIASRQHIQKSIDHMKRLRDLPKIFV